MADARISRIITIGMRLVVIASGMALSLSSARLFHRQFQPFTPDYPDAITGGQLHFGLRNQISPCTRTRPS